MTEREALKQLLEALHKELPHNMKHIAAGQRFNARTALAQPEPEPVAWLSEGGHFLFEPWQGSTPLYTTPPQRKWVGLTDEEKAEIQSLKWWDWEDAFDLDGYTRAIEAKLKEKNT